VARTVTLASLVARVRQRADIVNATLRHTDAEIQDNIQESATELYDLIVEAYGADYYIASTTLVTVANIKVVSLPTDFYKIVGLDVTYNGKNYALSQFEFANRNKYGDLTWGAPECLPRYRIWQDHLYLAPTPKSVYSLLLHYVKRMQALTDTAPAVYFDGINGWEEYIVLDSAIKALLKDDLDPSALMARKAEISARIVRMAPTRDAANPTCFTDTMGGDVESILWWGE
jgi:hypothetical protein